MVRPTKRRHVLVVENDTSMQKLLHSLLVASGYQSTTAAENDTVLKAVEEAPEPFSLAIVDFAPGLNASGVVRALRAHPGFGSQPILALTSAARDEDIRHLLDCGCDAYLRKPFHLSEFQDVVVSLILGTPITDATTDVSPGSGCHTGNASTRPSNSLNAEDRRAYGFR